ncbi:hypothetical protein CRM22_010992 [Opisthorchis felineus]|uniref:Uncharacterized protein n=1 Tax=Opisthorchis felineus TaxID=147828 RepID=A0A4S2KF83_OPIFE|nr:hypothetical protein CRM22_010992 [Opisthorchis felineus]
MFAWLLVSPSLHPPLGLKTALSFFTLTAESTELCGLAVAAIACESPSVLMARSSNIVLMSDVVAQYALRVPGEPAPPNYRSLNVLLRLGGVNEELWTQPESSSGADHQTDGSDNRGTS